MKRGIQACKRGVRSPGHRGRRLCNGRGVFTMATVNLNNRYLNTHKPACLQQGRAVQLGMCLGRPADAHQKPNCIGWASVCVGRRVALRILV